MMIAGMRAEIVSTTTANLTEKEGNTKAPRTMISRKQRKRPLTAWMKLLISTRETITTTRTIVLAMITTVEMTLEGTTELTLSIRAITPGATTSVVPKVVPAAELVAGVKLTWTVTLITMATTVTQVLVKELIHVGESLEALIEMMGTSIILQLVPVINVLPLTLVTVMLAKVLEKMLKLDKTFSFKPRRATRCPITVIAHHHLMAKTWR